MTIPDGRAFGSEVRSYGQGSGMSITFAGSATIAGDLVQEPDGTGTQAITVAPGSTLTIGGALRYAATSAASSVSNGFNTAANSVTVTVAGLDISSTYGTYTLRTGDGTWSIGGDVDLTGADVFAAGSGTVALTTTASITSAGKSFATLAIAPSATATITLADAASATTLAFTQLATATLTGTPALTLGSGGISRADQTGTEGVHTIACPLTLGANLVIANAADGGRLVASGIIDESGGARTLSTSGAGTTVLSAANTYTGTTALGAGTLLANNSSGSATGTGNISVAASATLGGTGTCTGTATVDGTLAPGDAGVGTLALGALTLNSGATIAIQFAGSSHDVAAVTGALAVDGSVQVSTATTITNGTYQIITTAAPPLTDNSIALGSMPTGAMGALAVDTNSVDLTSDSTAPTFAFSAVTSPRNSAVGTVTITATETTSGFDIADLSLTRNAAAVSLTNALVNIDATTWTIDLTPDTASDGAYVLTLTASGSGITDTLGNALAANATRSFTVDTTAPTVTVTALTTNDTTPTIAGTVSDGTLTVTVNSVAYTVGADLTVSGTNWSLTVPTGNALTAATYSVTASSTDTTGNTGTDATSNELIVDLTAPTVTVTALTTNDATPTIAGTVSDGTLTVTVNSVAYTVGADLTVSGTNWSLTIPSGNALAANTYSVTASSTDAAGNAGTDATSNELVVDLTAPTVTVTALSTNDATPTIAGTVSDGTLTVTVNSVAYTVGADLTVSGTNWSLTVPIGNALADGTYEIAASSTDAAGNTGTDATSNELVVDLTAPTVTVTALITNDTTPTIAGTVSDGTLTVTVNSVAYTVGADLTVSGTNWSLTVPTGNALADGTYEIAASSTDTAGNTGSDASANELTISTSTPIVTLTTAAADPLNAAFTVTATWSEPVTGFAAGDLVVGNGALSAFTAIDATTWTMLVTPGADGAVTVDVPASSASNGAGTSNPPATQLSRTYDGTAPELTIATVSPDPRLTPVSTLGLAASEALTGLTLGDLALTRDGNAVDLSAAPFTVIDATHWSIDLTAVTNAIGTYELRVVASAAVDAAGNALAADAIETWRAMAAPIGSAATIGTARDVPAIGDADASDADSASLTMTIGTAPTHGSVAIDDAATGAFTYTPTSGYAGADSFTVVWTDTDSNASAPATISIHVTGHDEPRPQLAANLPRAVVVGDTWTATLDFDVTQLGGGADVVVRQVGGSDATITRISATRSTIAWPAGSAGHHVLRLAWTDTTSNRSADTQAVILVVAAPAMGN